jgi:hypothetical protein
MAFPSDKNMDGETNLPSWKGFKNGIRIHLSGSYKYMGTFQTCNIAIFILGWYLTNLESLNSFCGLDLPSIQPLHTKHHNLEFCNH